MVLNAVRRPPMMLRRLGLLLLCFAVTLAVFHAETFPLDEGLPFGDYGQMVWDLWVVHHNAAHGLNPLRTNLAFYPLVADLTHHSLAGGFLPLTAAVHRFTRGPLYPLYAYRLGLWLCRAIGLFCAYGMLRSCGFSRLASAFPAVACTFCVFYRHHIHLTLLSGALILPLNGWLLVRWYKSPSTGRLLAASVTFAASIYFTEFTAFFAVAAAIYAALLAATAAGRAEVGARLRRTTPRGALVSAVAALAVAGPFLVNFATAPRVLQPDPTDHSLYSANLMAFFVPATCHDCVGVPDTAPPPLYGQLFEPLARRVTAGLSGAEAFIGYGLCLPVLVALLTVRRNPRHVNLSLAVAAFLLVLALGPTLKVFATDTRLPLPYRLLIHLPPFHIQRAPVRIVAVAVWLLSVPAAAGAARAAEALRSRFRHPRAGSLAAASLLAGLVMFCLAENWEPRIHLPRYALPAAVADVPEGPVVNLPLLLEDGFACALQVAHHQPMATGYLARLTKAQRARYFGLAEAWINGPEAFCEYAQTLGIRTVLIGPPEHPNSSLRLAPSPIAEFSKLPINVIDLRPHKPVPVYRFGSVITSGAAWNAPGAQVIPAGHDLTYRAPAPLAANAVEILADANDEYLIRFLRDGNVVFEYRAPQTFGRGLHWRASAIPTTPFDTVTITPYGGDGVYSVGSIAFWAE